VEEELNPEKKNNIDTNEYLSDHIDLASKLLTSLLIKGFETGRNFSSELANLID
jgi:hypothetical protein